jgi:hypothetical protein
MFFNKWHSIFFLQIVWNKMEVTPWKQTHLLVHKFQTNAIFLKSQLLVESINWMYETTLVVKEK